MNLFVEQWFKHTALDLGYAVQDLNHFFDPEATGATGKHKYLHAFYFRSKSLAKNLLYAALPPQLHHNQRELNVLCTASARDLFKYAMAPWQNKNPMNYQITDE